MKNTRSTVLTVILIVALIALSIWFRAHITVILSLGVLLLIVAVTAYKKYRSALGKPYPSRLF